jgi:hypothetical protein
LSESLAVTDYHHASASATLEKQRVRSGLIWHENEL